MPRIRIKTTAESARSALPGTRASADDFGAGVGRAVAGFGHAVAGVGATIGQKARQQQHLDDNIKLAQIRTSENERLVEAQANADEGAEGFTEGFLKSFEETSTLAMEGLSGARAKRMKLGLENIRGSLVNQATRFEARETAKMRARQIRDQADDGINAIRADPTQYETIMKDMNPIFSAMGLDGGTEKSLKDNFSQNAARARFLGLMDGSRSMGQIDKLENELKGKKWQELLPAKVYDGLLDYAEKRRGQIERKGTANAAKAMRNLAARIKLGEEIPQETLNQVEQVIMGSSNPLHIDQYAALRATYETKKDNHGVTPDVLRDRLGEIKEPKNVSERYEAIALQQLAADMVKGLEDDPLKFADEQDIVPMEPLDMSPESFAQRAANMAMIEDYYAGSGAKIDKIFTDAEVMDLKQQFDEGDAQAKVDLATLIGSMGAHKDMALAQLDQTDGKMAYIASMAVSEQPDAKETALVVARGQTMLDADPKLADIALGKDTERRTSFIEYIGSSLLNRPGVASSVMTAADAHYVAKHARAGGEFNETAYQDSINSVLGGDLIDVGQGTAKTITPPGVSGEEFEEFLAKIGIEDLAWLSLSGQPPVYQATGEIIAPEWFEDEAVWVGIAPGQYGFVDSLGNVLNDKAGDPYIMKIDRRAVQTIDDPVSQTGRMPSLEDLGFDVQ